MKDTTGELSPLEQDVLQLLWPNTRLKVRQIYNILHPKKRVALTSIAVALDRLHARGFVDRIIQKGRGGLRYVYFPKKSKEEVEKSMIERAVNSLVDKFGPAAVTYFNERFPRAKR